MAGEETRYEQLVRKLRTHGFRITPQRAALLRLIATNDAHPSASHLYAQMKAQFPSTSPATVYKTLHLLQQLGEVLELGFSDDDNRYDGRRPYPHPHLICVRCHRIVDPDVDAIGDLTEQIAEQSGYSIVSHRLDFYGMCPACRHP